MMNDRIVLVLGSEGLIGKPVCDLLTERGATVIRGDLRFSDKSELCQEIDVSDQESVVSAMLCIQQQFGRLDGLVNNAYPRTDDWGLGFEEISLESWDKNVQFQLNSVFYSTQQALKLLKKGTEAAVVNLSSIYGILGNDFSMYENTEVHPPAPYSAIKGGIISMTRYMASYFSRYAIRVNCVSPGGVFNQQDDHFVERYSKKVPLGRMANPEEIGSVINFLLSSESSYITGQNIVVDGGYSII